MKRGSIVSVLFLMISIACIAAARTWTDKTGKHRIDAEFVGFTNGKVQLKKSDGNVIGVSIGKLSVQDQKWVRDEVRKNRNTTQVAVANNVSGKTLGEWAQWRGPNRDGVCNEKGLLKEWPQSGPPIVWSTTDAGKGYSSVAVADGRVITMGNRRGAEELVAFSVEDGSPLWSAPVGRGNDCNCTPTIDGDLVFGLGRNGDLVCVEAATGREVWRKAYAQDFGGKMMSDWGYSESPLVDGDRLIVTPGGSRAMLAALNKRTGEVIWKAGTGFSGAGYASPVISNGGGVKQYITLVGRGLVGVAADDGRVLWQYEKIANTTANVPTPIVKGDYVFGSSGYGDGGSALLKLERSGGGVRATEVYYKRNNELQNHHGGMILIGDYIYMGHGHNKGLPACVEMETGRIVWGPERGPGTGSAAIVAADGNLYFRYQNGIMALIEASPRGYNMRGSFRIATVNGNSWAHPVIADKKLYLRDQKDLHCYNIAAR